MIDQTRVNRVTFCQVILNHGTIYLLVLDILSSRNTSNPRWNRQTWYNFYVNVIRTSRDDVFHLWSYCTDDWQYSGLRALTDRFDNNSLNNEFREILRVVSERIVSDESSVERVTGVHSRNITDRMKFLVTFQIWWFIFRAYNPATPSMIFFFWMHFQKECIYNSKMQSKKWT